MPFYVSSGLYVGRECVSCAQVYVLSVCSGYKVKLEVATSKFNILSLLYYIDIGSGYEPITTQCVPKLMYTYKAH